MLEIFIALFFISFFGVLGYLGYLFWLKKYGDGTEDFNHVQILNALKLKRTSGQEMPSIKHFSAAPWRTNSTTSSDKSVSYSIYEPPPSKPPRYSATGIEMPMPHVTVTPAS